VSAVITAALRQSFQYFYWDHALCFLVVPKIPNTHGLQPSQRPAERTEPGTIDSDEMKNNLHVFEYFGRLQNRRNALE